VSSLAGLNNSLPTHGRWANPLTHREQVYGISVTGNQPKTSSFRVPYRHHSSSANWDIELIKPSNDSASLLVFNEKECLVEVADFLRVTS